MMLFDDRDFKFVVFSENPETGEILYEPFSDRDDAEDFALQLTKEGLNSALLGRERSYPADEPEVDPEDWRNNIDVHRNTACLPRASNW